MFPGDGYASDSSDSSDRPSDLTRAEAARLYPEACHQVLAATLGLVYSQIRNEVGEGPLSHMMQRAPKRSHDDAASARHRPSKAPARSKVDNDSPTRSYKILQQHGVQTVDTKSAVSEGFDKLGYNINASQMSDETMTRLKDIVAEEVNNRLLREIERGAVKIQPDSMERGRRSPTDLSVRTRLNEGRRSAGPLSPANKDEVPTEPNTVATEIISPRASETGSP